MKASWIGLGNDGSGRVCDVLDNYDATVALHSRRISLLSRGLGKSLGLSAADLQELALAGQVIAGWQSR